MWGGSRVHSRTKHVFLSLSSVVQRRQHDIHVITTSEGSVLGRLMDGSHRGINVIVTAQMFFVSQQLYTQRRPDTVTAVSKDRANYIDHTFPVYHSSYLYLIFFFSAVTFIVNVKESTLLTKSRSQLNIYLLFVACCSFAVKAHKGTITES